MPTTYHSTKNRASPKKIFSSCQIAIGLQFTHPLVRKLRQQYGTIPYRYIYYYGIYPNQASQHLHPTASTHPHPLQKIYRISSLDCSIATLIFVRYIPIVCEKPGFKETSECVEKMDCIL